MSTFSHKNPNFCDCNINPIWMLSLKGKLGFSKAPGQAWLYLPGKSSNFLIQRNACLSAYCKCNSKKEITLPFHWGCFDWVSFLQTANKHLDIGHEELLIHLEIKAQTENEERRKTQQKSGNPWPVPQATGSHSTVSCSRSNHLKIYIKKWARGWDGSVGKGT